MPEYPSPRLTAITCALAGAGVFFVKTFSFVVVYYYLGDTVFSCFFVVLFVTFFAVCVFFVRAIFVVAEVVNGEVLLAFWAFFVD